MASLSQALRLEDLPSSHSAFQGHAAHIIEWPMMLRPKDSEGTCIPSGVPTFLQAASRRSLRSDYYGLFDCLGGLGVSLGSRLPTLHPPSHPFQALPCSTRRTPTRYCRWRVSDCPIRSLRLPNVGTG